MLRVLLILFLVVNLIGCGSFKEHQISSEEIRVTPKRLERIYSESNNSGTTIPLSARTQQSSIETKRSLVYTAYFKIATQIPDSIHMKVVALAKEYNGYIVRSELNLTTIRVEALNLKEIVEKIKSTGKVVSKNVIGTDVTDEYYDYNIRLENAIKTRDRYLQLLEKAVDVKDILSIEKELERMNNSIDYLKGKINNMSHLIQFATITVQTTEELKPGIVGSVFTSIYKGVKWLFVR